MRNTLLPVNPKYGPTWVSLVTHLYKNANPSRIPIRNVEVSGIIFLTHAA